MKKLTTLTAVLCIMLFAAAATAAPKEFAIANDSTDDTVTGLMTQKLKEVLEAKSKGAFKVATFPNSQLGSDREITQSCQNGELAFVVQNTAPQVNFVPKAAVFDLPNLFPNKKVARAALDKFQKDIEPEYAKAGIVMLGFGDQGFRVLSSNKAINKIEDFKGLRLRTMENKYHVQYWQSLGANPTPLPFSELYLALQQGTVTGQENPYEVIVATKLYEVQKYVIDTNHLFHTITIIMSKNIYDQLTPDEQKLVRDAAREVITWGREQADKRHADRVAILKKNNVQIIKLDEKLLGEMQAKSKPVYDNISKAVGADLVKKLQDAVKEASK
ncbi:TRAP transporter substrate-binding protein [Cloacibacillus porcorum]|uniref:TRAP transporter substrate-binding protein n=1 Tax=Cloacibacillus porcorum TaxID=1197717 RepID=UPI0023F0F86D|nr:TRAP transporter substrate-binding protein [Cloacibacillus porcorum]MDD7649464.1 TRAP transporter substrate-binding protein [Cloacibacillus porcorum]MDY4093179.1 TRAP transporter substrate-binding protein [Cloacibacillus porcorum]